MGMRDAKGMGAGRRAMEGGFTLVELMVVVSIIGILSAVMAFTFTGWRERARVEGEARKIYFDLMNARADSLQSNRARFFLIINSTEDKSALYSVASDSNPSPDGDGVFTAGSDTVISNSVVGFLMEVEWRGFNATTPPSIMVSKGRFDGDASVWVALDPEEAKDPDEPDRNVDCVKVEATRVGVGLANLVWSGTEWEWDALGTCTVQ